MTNHDSGVELYLNIRAQTVSICQPLEIEDYVVQPVAEVSPPKWHLAHTTWFFENFILNQFVEGYQKFDPVFDELFNSYYKSCGKHWLQGQRGILSRPTVKQVMQYRAHVDQQMVDLLNSQWCMHPDLPMLTEMGLHHEQQHQELLYMDIKYVLAANPTMPVYHNKPLPAIADTTLGWVDMDAGLYQIGMEKTGFAYDNEKPAHSYYLNDYVIATQLIRNGDYLAFMEDKGYEKPLLWLSDGWNWVLENHISSPLYWHRHQGEWFEFTLHGPKPLDLNSPVTHVSYYEANAFANWYGARLPTEQELEVYLTHHPDDEVADRNSYFHPTHLAVNKQQLWAWTQSAYAPYPGYRPYAGALGEYNGKFMCNQQVLRGSCFATPTSHYRPSYRNFYFPHQNWMFSGICLAKDK
ncbi:ergothioneine biosynthesis protein EgtB [Legionella sp. W05-934-2]|uniref:ergothioneine biosynthesis protein EgtB n=1 Tax=Legionella sp. W05-934-2 TaxID=1198649 RepID=UPI00346200E3